MTKDDVLKAHGAAFEAGARLARANEFLISAKLVVDKARLEVDHAGAEYHAASNAANKASADAFKAIGESVRKEQDAAIDGTKQDVVASDATADVGAVVNN
jgi:hypothetical protein